MLVAGCSDSAGGPQSFTWGPYMLAPGQEILEQCVQVTLHNDQALWVSSVEMSAGAGFHHSNWFVVPEHVYAGPDGTFPCSERDYNEAIAGTLGSVLFAQSTQATHEVQAFGEGAAIKVPAHWKIIAGTHLLNASDQPLEVPLSLTITTIPEADVTTKLAAMSWDNRALGLPPHRASRFTIECDLQPAHQRLFGTDPDFSIHYALAHYHKNGTGLRLEAVRPDGTSTVVYETSHRIGDQLGGKIEPPFAMTGYTKLRVACSYDNTTDATISWGLGDGEMCTFLAFTDSPYAWGGGALDISPPGTGVDSGTIVDFTHGCDVIPVDASH